MGICIGLLVFCKRVIAPECSMKGAVRRPEED